MPHLIRKDDTGTFDLLVTANPAGVQIDTVGGSVELSEDAARWLLEIALPDLLHRAGTR